MTTQNEKNKAMKIGIAGAVAGAAVGAAAAAALSDKKTRDKVGNVIKDVTKQARESVKTMQEKAPEIGKTLESIGKDKKNAKHLK